MQMGPAAGLHRSVPGVQLSTQASLTDPPHLGTRPVSLDRSSVLGQSPLTADIAGLREDLPQPREQCFSPRWRLEASQARSRWGLRIECGPVRIRVLLLLGPSSPKGNPELTSSPRMEQRRGLSSADLFLCPPPVPGTWLVPDNCPCQAREHAHMRG